MRETRYAIINGDVVRWKDTEAKNKYLLIQTQEAPEGARRKKHSDKDITSRHKWNANARW